MMHGNPSSPVSLPTSLGAPPSADGPAFALGPTSDTGPAVVGSSVVGSTAVSTEYYVHQAHPPSDPSPVVVGAIDVQREDLLTAEPSDYFRIKTILDRLVTVVLMIIAVPLMLLVAMAVLVCNGRPIFFRQIRVGKNGKRFRIWKFRTMQNDAELRTGAVWSNASDTRVTKLGRWLRCSHLDELPQLINVLAGEMNLVGPRPETTRVCRTLVEASPRLHESNLGSTWDHGTGAVTVGLR